MSDKLVIQRLAPRVAGGLVAAAGLLTLSATFMPWSPFSLVLMACCPQQPWPDPMLIGGWDLVGVGLLLSLLGLAMYFRFGGRWPAVLALVCITVAAAIALKNFDQTMALAQEFKVGLRLGLELGLYGQDVSVLADLVGIVGALIALTYYGRGAPNGLSKDPARRA